MNLLEMQSYVTSLLGDVGEDLLTPGEIIMNLNHAQNRVSNLLVHAEQEKFVAKTPSIPTVIGQADYVLPLNVQDIFRVEVNGQEAFMLPQVHGSAPGRLPTHRPSNRQMFYLESLGEAGRIQITLVPTTVAATLPIYVWYVVRPDPFHAEFGIVDKGSVTASATLSTTKIISPVPFAGTATNNGVDDFWNGAEIRFTSGKNQGITRRIQDFDAVLAGVPDYGVLILRTDDALPNVPVAADTFELCQVSIIPPQHHELLVMYAAALCAPKAKRDADPFFAMFKEGIQAIAGKYTQNVEKVLPGQGATGAR